MEERDIEIEKCREMITWFMQGNKSNNSPSNPNIPASSPRSLEIPENSFIKRWRTSDKIFDGKYSSSGASTPQTPGTPIHDLEKRLKSMSKPQSMKSGPQKCLFGNENFFNG